MKILHVASEFYPLLKTGGLADVVGALPYAQQGLGADVRVLLPAYPKMLAEIQTDQVAKIMTFAGQVILRYGQYNGLGIYLIDAPHLYQRVGNPYHDEHYQDYADNYLRFALLGYIGAELSTGLDPFWSAEVVHAHDWHAGLTCAYLHQKGQPAKSAFTVHNLAYKGVFSALHLSELGLNADYFHINGLEWHGQLSYLKAGLFFADVITAVSPTYAQEITTPEYGEGLEGLLQTRASEEALFGILNGVDYGVWSPERDKHLLKNYTPADLSGKKIVKKALQEYFGLKADPEALLCVMVSRLTTQKGVHLLLANIPHFMANGVQLIILGAGDKAFEEALLNAQQSYPEQIGVKIGYDEGLSHLIIAGGDAILVPSAFEPCGLTQLYGLKYGTLPIVRQTGGLADSVSEGLTGFVFPHLNSIQLGEALNRAKSAWSAPEIWLKMQMNAMNQDFSWHQSAQRYLNLYQSL